MTALVVLTADELRGLVKTAVLEALAANTNASPAETLPLKACGVSVRTLRAAIGDGELPAVKAGREFRVRRGDLDKWLASRAVKPKTNAEPPPDDPVTRALRSGALRAIGKAA